MARVAPLPLFPQQLGDCVRQRLPVRLGAPSVGSIDCDNGSLRRQVDLVDVLSLGHIHQVSQVLVRHVHRLLNAGRALGGSPGVGSDFFIQGDLPENGAGVIFAPVAEEVQVLAPVIARLKCVAILEAVQVIVLCIDLWDDLDTCPKGLIHPTTQAVSPALYRTGKVGTEDGIDGGSDALKHGQHYVRKIKEQPRRGAQRIYEHVCHKVCHHCDYVVDDHKHVHHRHSLA